MDETTLLTSMSSAVQCRLMPLQLLGQKAARTEHKVARLHLALGADCQSVETCLNRTYSCAFDIPIGDADHSLHHCLQELKSCFSHWSVFYSMLNSLTKYFGNWSRLNRFRSMCILKNEQFRSISLRESFAAMFKSPCPSLQEQREYLPLGLFCCTHFFIHL